MKIFLYNKYLSTAGGGEKHAGGIAEVLSKKNDVTILHSGDVNVDWLSNKLNLDLSGVKLVSFGHKDEIDFDVHDYVNEHRPDVFINATYYSSLLTNAPLNVTLIFFPRYNRISEITFFDKLKYKIGNHFFKEYNQTIKFHEGFGHEELINSTVGRWTGKRSTILINKPFKKASVYYENLSNRIIRDSIDSIAIHGHKLNFNISKSKLEFNNHSKHACGIHLNFNTFKPSNAPDKSSDTRDLGLFITQVDSDGLTVFSRILLKAWRNKVFKKYFTRLYIKTSVLQEHNYYKHFLTQNINLTNSAYTDKWLRKIYGHRGIRTQILYPPVDVEHFECSQQKEKIIICVGRFFVGGHNKKQIEIIKAFKKLFDRFPELKDYTLHICGGTHPEQQHQEYLRKCLLSAQGYPIEIHTDITFKKLIDLYSKAKIFWHAAGMYENENIHPDKFEHFGITTVEAMASGCVPVVIGVAGQKEIVTHLQNGMLWNSEHELEKFTLQLIRDEQLCRNMSLNAKKSAKKFCKTIFEKRVGEIFDNLLDNHEVIGNNIVAIDNEPHKL